MEAQPSLPELFLWHLTQHVENAFDFLRNGGLGIDFLPAAVGAGEVVRTVAKVRRLLEVEQVLRLRLLPAAAPKVAALTPFAAALVFSIPLRLCFQA
jgi:hypothetical protein